MPELQTENGPRYVAQDDYDGQKMEVRAGYDIATDSWRYHAYVISLEGRHTAVRSNEPADNMKDAFERGFAAGRADIDRRSGKRAHPFKTGSSAD